jgi:hypothetical protein
LGWPVAKTSPGEREGKTVKRDMELVREVRKQVEEKGPPRGWAELDIPGHSPEEVSYHVMILNEAGLLEGKNLSTMQDFEWKARRLTAQGHDFLDAIRNETV